MAGSLRTVEGRPGTWQLRVYLGRDAENRVRHRHVTFKGSRRQAERELARLVAEQESRRAAVPEQPAKWRLATTVNDAIAAWRDNGWDDLSRKTSRHYESIWRVHIAPTIGRLRIAGLATYDVERYYRSLKADARPWRRYARSRPCCTARAGWSGGVLPNPSADADLPT